MYSIDVDLKARHYWMWSPRSLIMPSTRRIFCINVTAGHSAYYLQCINSNKFSHGIDQAFTRCTRHTGRHVVSRCIRYSSLDGSHAVGVAALYAGYRTFGVLRERCHYCLDVKRTPDHQTRIACSCCVVKLCKIPCFAKFHELLRVFSTC